jgi:ABC-type glycerol-3-phosphate transport system substrate-binding protein
MTVAFGGGFADRNGTLNPDSTGGRLALQTIAAYRKQFGVDNVTAFESSAAYLTESDPFLNGKQAMRIDGPWFGKIAREDFARTSLNYRVVPLPYPDGHPELSGSNLVRSSVFYIAANARNKPGAWAFVSWLHQEKQMSSFGSQMGMLPARLSSLNSPLFKNAYDFKAFADMARSKNLRTFPAIPDQAEYLKLVSDAGDLAMLLKATPADALAAAARKTASLGN